MHYRLEGCDWSALDSLGKFDIDCLRKCIGGKPAAEMRDGSRKLWLNDFLCSHAMHCDTFAELLDVAHHATANFAERGLDMLDPEIVVKRARAVWDDAQAGKLEAWCGREGMARASASELDELSRLDPKNAPDAFFLFMRFRLDHSARCRRGETFNITPKAMERADVIPGWHWKRYARGRDILVQAGFIERVASFRMTADGREGAQYRLASSPSLKGGYGRQHPWKVPISHVRLTRWRLLL